MPGVDDLIARARSARVADDEARAYVAELGRWARVEPAPARRMWSWWLGGGLALAATAAVILLVVGRRPTAIDVEPVRVGERVALIPESGAVYRVTATDATHTQIDVERGTVTARLFKGEAEHQLALVGGGVTANATGTVYSLTVDNGHGAVEVHEGTVRVDHDATSDSIAAGGVWPPSAPRRAHRVEALISLAPLPSTTPSPSTPTDAAVADAAVVIEDAAVMIEDAPPRALPDAAVKVTPLVDAGPSITEQWRRARLLRGQGDFAGAIAECLAIADAHDATWSPTALLEAARIELGPRVSPERAIVLAERFEREWSTHQLAPEARELRCRALRQLGRGAECVKAP